ncbi:hypothetical protein ACFFJB_06725 [Camelimonas abortus]|uniref:autotransporter outer membrane beta-barrel domain-containing protein n=1 Tax=Camelimonas abortus TaxID=1017184 RepID=UPI0035EBEDB0
MTPYQRRDAGAPGGSAGEGRNATNGQRPAALWFNTVGAMGGGGVLSGPLVEVTVEGGTGGDAFGHWLHPNGLAGTGGAGGDLVLVHDAGVSVGLSPQPAGASLFRLLSRGGKGGASAVYGLGGYEYGGSGGAGGDVTFTTGATIGVSGDRFAVLRATSQGGDGRGGRHGGASGHVLVDIRKAAVISTRGLAAPAIIAEALGGAGGGSEHGHLVLVDGGAGGAGAGQNAGTGVTAGAERAGVSLVSYGAISTFGALSTAVLLQNIGGAGATGMGGGDGGAGGAAGAIAAQQHGTISTEGAYSFGLVAQSVGGSGGDGGRGFFTGAPGGAAGKGGAVFIENTGAVTTSGEGATALVAQSVGGGAALDAFQAQAILPGGVKPREGGGLDVTAAPGGGSGGNSVGLFFSRGGPGGTGGDGGAVSLVNRGHIATGGEAAYGILAQSVGGSGGAAGDSLAIGGFLAVAIGGKGGGGGHGGAVSIGSDAAARKFGEERAKAVAEAAAQLPAGLTEEARAAALAQAAADFGAHYSSIATSGDNAAAIIAQSIGGGGGSGGSSIAASAGYLGAVSVAIGGAGGKGGDGGSGGAVTARNVNAIVTTGASATGIDALSVGGGGGSGGNAFSYALALQTTAMPSIDVSVTVGGKGGAGGAVTVMNSDRIQTGGVAAAGVSAMSVGGGGGKAGDAASVAGLMSFYFNAALPVTIGGSGGDGGAGGAVTVENAGRIETLNQFSNAIDASSIGGGGGAGNIADTAADTGAGYTGVASDTLNALVGLLPIAKAVTANITIGGSGGGGGAGGAVTITNSGALVTRGSNSAGVAAYSIGGGGGSGGGFQGGGKGHLAGNLRIGGSGGKGGAGGAVKVTNADGATIVTEEAGSHGVFAQSVGGGGGNGGTFTGKRKSAAISAIGAGKQNWLAVGMKLFGELGKVSDVRKLAFPDRAPEQRPGETDEAFQQRRGEYEEARRLRNENAGKGFSLQGLMTGAKRLTILVKAVQSIISRQEQIEKLQKDRAGKTGAALAAIDDEIARLRALQVADGLDGGLTLALNVYKEKLKGVVKEMGVGLAARNAKRGGSLQAWEDDYPSASLNLSIGGAGGEGGAGGAVTVVNNGRISTKGEVAYGVFAQSVGGGGGAGGAGFATGENQVNVNVAIGRNGAGGGAGGRVEVRNSRSVATTGDMAFGLLAQSVGGGGGLGGASSAENAISASLNVTVGGDGGASGAGGEVVVVNSGEVTTAGVDAHAVVAQSVGGGGVFFNNLKSPRELELERQKEDAARASRGAGALTREEQELVAATDEAVGLIQSFVNWIAGDPQAAGDAGIDRWATVLPTPSVNVSFGGNGRAGGKGGGVKVTHTGAIATGGEGAFGIFAQSVGGGGGLGANASHGGLLSASWTVGGRGGAAGDAGAVDIRLGGGSSVVTGGDGAHAIFAQSIGGGGGYGGAARSLVMPDFVNAGGSSGNGGNIVIRTGGPTERTTIITTGVKAHGVFAQSIGGGGGMVANLLGPEIMNSTAMERPQARGSAGMVTIDTAGVISATGLHSYGIYVQGGVQKTDGSIASGAGGGLVSITYAGVITGGAGEGAAIRADTPARTHIEIRSGSRIEAASGKAILTPLGSALIINHGAVIGDVLANAAEFRNMPGALYQSVPGGQLKLGATHDGVFPLFINAGVFNVGGSGVIATTTVAGDYRQDPGGVLAIDISPAPGTSGLRSDLLRVLRSAGFHGQTHVQPNALTFLLPGSYVFVEADGGISGAPQVTGAPEVAVPVTWTVEPRNLRTIGRLTLPTQLSLSPHADFTRPRGVLLTPDQQGVANTVQAAWEAASTAQGAVFPRLLGIVSPVDYARSLDEMSAQEKEAASSMTAIGARVGLRAPLSCPAFSGTGVMLSENECLWGQIQGGVAHMATSHAEYGYRVSTLSYRFGGQKEVRPDWFLGFSAAYSQGSATHRDDIAGGQSETYEGSVALKRQIGPWTFAASATAGSGWHRSARLVSLGGAQAVARSKQQNVFAGLRLRGAYEFALGSWYVKPYVDFDALYVRSPAYSEWGAPGFNLDVRRSSQGVFAVSPNVEVGGRIDLDGGYWMRPYGVVGFTLLSSDESSSIARLQGAPAGVGAFRTASRLPYRLLDMGFGLQVAADNGMELTAEYQASMAHDFIAHRGGAKFVIKF